MSAFDLAQPVEGHSERQIADLQDLTARIHQRFVAEADLGAISRLSREELATPVGAMTALFLAEEGLPLVGRQREKLAEAVISEISGLGPLDSLLANPEITEIMVNGPNEVYIERAGKLSKCTLAFQDEAHIRRIMERIVAPLGRRIDEASPMVDCRLADGSRVNCIIPPLAVRGPSLTIRKFAPVPYTIHNLVRFGTLSSAMADFLQCCVEARLNILVSGGTGSGKTTTLNALSGFIPADERIITIEDAAELQLQQEHVVSLESRPPNWEGRGEVTIRHLVRNALRMRPDRIVIGEVRGEETLDLLAAMNTGHDGSLSTVHANSPRDVLSRLETLALMAGTELPLRAVREQIASALQLIVHQVRRRDGSRRVSHITEIQGITGEMIVLQDIYAPGTDGETSAMGLRPQVLHRIEERGFRLPPDWQS